MITYHAVLPSLFWVDRSLRPLFPSGFSFDTQVSIIKKCNDAIYKKFHNMYGVCHLYTMTLYVKFIVRDGKLFSFIVGFAPC